MTASAHRKRRLTAYGPAFVGRDTELGILLRMVDDAVAGHLSVAVVEGEAGIGKSRLLQHLAERAQAAGLDCCLGAAEDFAGSPPCGPLLAAVGAAVSGNRDTDSAGEIRFVPDRRLELLELVLDRLAARAARGPVVVLLDDLQWADSTTLFALRALPKRLSGLGIALVLALRPVPCDAALTSTLTALGEHGPVRLTLGPLYGPAWRELQTSLLGNAPDADLVEWLDGAGGNPFLLTQIVHTMRHLGAVSDDGVRSSLSGRSVPPDFRSSVESMLAVLAPTTVDLLRVAAVLGSGFTAQQLGTVVDVPVARLEPNLREAVRAGILVAIDGRFAFRHDLLREAVYDDVLPAVRSGLHLDIAHRLTAAGARPASVVGHLIRGAQPDDPRSVSLLREAAHEIASTDPGAAADLLLRAHDLTPTSDPQRRYIGAEAIRLMSWAGRLDDAERHAARIVADGLDPDAEAQVRLGMVESLVFQGRCADAVAQAEAALARPVSDDIRGALLAAEANAKVFVSDPDDASATAVQAIELGARCADDHARCFGLIALSCAERFAGSLDMSLQHAEEAVDIADAGSAAARRCHPRLFLARTLAGVDRAAEAEACVVRGRVDAEALGSTWSLAMWQMIGADLDFRAGRLDDAAVAAEAGLALAEQWRTWSVAPLAIAVLVRVAVHRNDLDAASSWLATGHELVDEGVSMTAEQVLLATSVLREAQGEPAAALTGLIPLCDALKHRQHVLLGDPCVAPHMTRLALRAGDADRARFVADVTQRLADDHPAVASLVAASRHARGLITGDVALLEQSVIAAAEAGWPLGHAEACEAAAYRLCAVARPADAIRHLETASAIYLRARADRDTSRVDARLRELGVRHRRPSAARPATGWAALTPAEVRIARLVTEGLTNQRIAARLFVSPHTVDTHLRHVFAKLGIGSRVQLANIASRNPENT